MQSSFSKTRQYYGAAHSDALPLIFSMAWVNAGMMTARFSRTARGLPGRFMISVVFRIPHTAREIMALGVFLRLSALMASDMPGKNLSRTAIVASGVTSLGVTPVPPVVRTTSSFLTSAYSISLAFIIET